jgi:transcriptional regulator with XRE-family HTH domain
MDDTERMATLAALAKKVRRLRKLRDLNQVDLAALAGVSRDIILQIEKGEKDHGYSKVVSVLKALDVDIESPGTETAAASRRISDAGVDFLQLLAGVPERQREAVMRAVRMILEIQSSPPPGSEGQTAPPPTPPKGS